MRTNYQQESFVERCFNRIFKGLSFKEIGLELTRVKEIVEVERIENYKRPLLMFLLEDDSLLHVEIINDEIKPDLQSMLTYDMSIVLRYRMQVKTFILNFGSAQNGERGKCFGSLCYEAQIVDLSGIDAGKVYEELSQKIGSSCLLDGRDKLKLVFLPFMKNSLSFNEVLPKVMSLIEKMKDEEERMAYLTIISEIVSRLIGKQGVEVLKEYLMDTEVGIRIRDEGNKEGMRQSIIIILLEKFNVLPDDIYYAIAKQNNEDTLMKWLQKLTNICSIDELKKMLFNIK
ncbi:MAG: hypothetical protein QHH06_05625 [Clostridiales bacterium]|jgi:hypothetical protein|nr:hypothetical protein [Clostridiales bacterium]